VLECAKVNNVVFNKNDVLLLKLREDSLFIIVILLFKVIGILVRKDNDVVVKEVEELEILTELLEEKLDGYDGSVVSLVVVNVGVDDVEIKVDI
jgi:hypothetical protein